MPKAKRGAKIAEAALVLSCRAMGPLFLAAAALAAPSATAQTTPVNVEPGKWRFTADIYGYLPAIDATVDYPGIMGSTSHHIPFSDLLSHLKMGLMGAVSLNNGHWGIYSDLLYMDLGTTKSQTRTLSLDGASTPALADTSLDLKAWVWTLAGDYRMVSDSKWTVDLLAGARMLKYRPTIDYTISTPGLQIVGSKEVSGTSWNGIVGIKGRYVFEGKSEWFVPFYLDVGTGDSRLTWQAVAGIGYSFHWGDVLLTYRYLDFNAKSGKSITNLSMSGPMLGVALHW